MFCSNCGSKAAGNYCASCGACLVAWAEPAQPTEPTPVIDWRHETRVDVLVQTPAVKDQLDRAAAGKRFNITGETFLDLFSELVTPGVPLRKVAEIVQPLYASWGIGTGKSRAGLVAAPPGQVIVAVLCWLAEGGRTLRQVRQGDDGCVLEATLPSDLFALAGDLIISIHREGSGTRVEASTRIGGQLFDWGKSTRCLSQLFDSLPRAA